MGIDFGPFVVVAIFGYLVIALLVGVGVGALLAVPFALWLHNFSLLIWPSVVGGCLSLGLVAWIMWKP